MAEHHFRVYEVDYSYHYHDAQSLILSKDTLTITDSDNQIDNRVSTDEGNDQHLSFAGEGEVASYKIDWLDYAKVNHTGPEYELYAMRVDFVNGDTKYYVMSKDEGFAPEICDDLTVTHFTTFTSTNYADIGAAVCYTPGCRILTPRGWVPVEQLKPGQRVQTADNGVQEILWVGQRFLSEAELIAAPHLRPVQISARQFGLERPLILSPQHRLMVDAALARKTGLPEQHFVHARHIALELPDLAQVVPQPKRVCYIHLLLARHEVLFADGLESESLFLGPQALTGISRADRREIDQLFPELAGVTPTTPHQLARPTLRRAHLRAVAQERSGARSPAG